MGALTKEAVHREVCEQIHTIWKQKNADYGDSFAKLRERYPNFVCMRMFDKLNRVENLIKSNVDPLVLDEKVEDTLLDIANYCIMEVVERKKEVQED